MLDRAARVKGLVIVFIGHRQTAEHLVVMKRPRCS